MPKTLTPRALTAAEAARKLGIGKDTLYGLIRSGVLPAARISERGDYRISPRVLDDFLTGQLQ